MDDSFVDDTTEATNLAAGSVERFRLSAVNGPRRGLTWDSASDLTEVLFGGVSGVTIPAGTAKVSDDTTYNLVLGNDLLVAFDVSLGAGSVRQAQVVGPKMFLKKNVFEAGLQNRTANYNARNNSVYIIEKIEVVA
jgi:hypothetical protein